jgi:hypothetical protein
MISLLTKPQNGNTTTQESYRRRLEEVLGNAEVGEESEPRPAELRHLPDAEQEALEPATTPTSVADTDGQDTGRKETLTGSGALSVQESKDSSGAVGLEHAAKQIANTLVGTLGRAIQDVHRQVSTDHTKLASTDEAVLRLSTEISGVNTTVLTLSARAEATALEQVGMASRLSEIDGRMTGQEQGSMQMRERLDSLFTGQEATTKQVEACAGTLSTLEARVLQLCERLEGLDAGLQSQIATSARLTALCEKLDQFHQSLAARVDSHGDMIHLLRSEVRQPIGMVERVLGSLRSLDLRKENRFPVDESAQITIEGEPETVIAGRVIDASESGLGLLLDTPLGCANKIRVDVNNRSLTGSVSYCLPKGDKHAVGVKLSHPLHDRGHGPDEAV